MRYIAQVDYGPEGNATRPRWFVFEQYFVWAGNHGTRRLAGPFWTDAEAKAELDRLNGNRVAAEYVVLTVLGLVLLLWLVLR